MAIELKPLEGGQGHIKAGLLGFPGSGKTYTATLLAVAVREHFKLNAPIAMFDTEAGAVWVDPVVRYLTGKPLLVVRTRALSDLLDVAKQCAEGAASALIVDSITHPWRETCDAFLAELNRALVARNRKPRTKLEWQDWAIVKGHGSPWSQWLDLFLNSPLHIVLCGRAGVDWVMEDEEQDDGSIKKQLRKAGIKMQVETQFGFEPALVVEMRRESIYEVETGHDEEIIHKAIVHKDRKPDGLTGAIAKFRSYRATEGKSDIAAHYEAVKAFFAPHIAGLTPGSVNAVDTALKTTHGVDTSGDAQYVRDRRRREIILEEVQGLITHKWPGMSAEEKKAKADVLELCWGTRSWTKLQKEMPLAQLELGFTKIKEVCNA